MQTARPFAPEWNAVGVNRSVLDLINHGAVREKFLRDRPRLIIHCGALSKNPACQANPALAWKTNFDATRNLADLAAETPFVFISTDLVFDGTKGRYVEGDAANPLSVYAETKLAAESAVLKNPLHTVVRTSLNAGNSPAGDRSFNEEMVREWRAGRGVKLFTDEYRSPIPAVVTARAIWELATKNQPGLYHLAGWERLSRFQIGQLVADSCPELHPKLAAGSLREYQGEPRAPDTSLDCSKVQNLLSFQLPKFSDWMRDHPAFH